jgi:subtilase family serine protease
MRLNDSSAERPDWSNLTADELPAATPTPIAHDSSPVQTFSDWAPHGVDLAQSVLPSAYGGDMGIMEGGADVFVPQVNPMAGTFASPAGFSPAQIRHAYGFDKLTGTDGRGVTIAIIDAYNAQNILNDVRTFNTQYGLQQFNGAGQPTFKVVNQGGGSSLPANNAGWAFESALDVEWAHAIAPKANILLVEASTASYSNLMAAVDYAAKNAQVVSMSFGGGEFSYETTLDAHFNKTGVAFVASSGDSGFGVSYPAASPYVLSVGGTSLRLDSTGKRISETGWSGSGGGISTIESEPTFQKNFGITATGGKRGNPDVSYDGDPSTGFAVYSSPNGGWRMVGGTSAGAPQWAGLIALVDQQRKAHGGTMLSTNNLANSPFYTAALKAVYASNFFDVTIGSNGKGSLDQAHSGYDFVTGLGSPNAANLVPYLATH